MIALVLGFGILFLFYGFIVCLIANEVRCDRKLVTKPELVDTSTLNKYEQEILELINSCDSTVEIFEYACDEVDILADELGKRSVPFGGGYATKVKGITKAQYYRGTTNKELDLKYNIYNKFVNDLIGVA